MKQKKVAHVMMWPGSDVNIQGLVLILYLLKFELLERLQTISCCCVYE